MSGHTIRAGLLRTPGMRVAPSLLSADFANLTRQVGALEAAGVEILHLDIMDGHFVPNLSFGVPVVQKLRAASGMFFDTHLMVTDPLRYAPAFAKAGCDLLNFHIEAVEDGALAVRRIRELGVAVGVTLNPGTPLEAVEAVLPDVDLVLVMSVWPGFGGQKFMPAALDRLAWLKARLRVDQRLQVDGGVGPATIAQAARAGADTFVAGSAVFDAPDPAEAWRELTKQASAAVQPAGR